MREAFWLSRFFFASDSLFGNWNRIPARFAAKRHLQTRTNIGKS